MIWTGSCGNSCGELSIVARTSLSSATCPHRLYSSGYTAAPVLRPETHVVTNRTVPILSERDH